MHSKHKSIKQQVISVSLLTTTVALLLTGIILIVDETIAFRSSLVNNLTAQAKIIGNNSTAAIAFNDYQAAEETLSALKAIPNVVYAIIYAQDGIVFARYKRADLKHFPVQSPSKEDYEFGINRLSVFQDIALNKEIIGTIYIQSELRELYVRIIRNTGTVIVLIALSIFVAFLLLSKLQHAITKPILDLTHLMQIVSTRRDYSVRSPIQRGYEMGFLSKGFNEMLEQIQTRDTEIKRSYEQLSQELAERKRAEETIKYMAYYDSLTGLPNRTLFNDRLSQAMRQVQRYGQKVAIVFFDLDNFKNINDTLGHTTGDLLLKAIAERLTNILRGVDTISHQGGDEFTILISGINHVQDVAKVAQKILDALSEKIRLDEHEIFITASMGISLYPSDGDSAETLVKNADIAMYAAKEQGRNSYQFYTPAMNTIIFERITLENSIRKALEKDEFIVYYQPRVDIKTGQTTGMEALVRWQHPDLGLVLPLKFIPLAEETGLIIPLGELVMWKACKQSKMWQDSGFPPLRIGVNFSARQFQQKNMIEMFTKILTNTGLKPDRLELEITESTIMRDIGHAASMLHELHDIGIKISIDDFGTGYSSLSYLKNFPIDMLKIDRSFMMGVATNHDDEAIVEAIIAMAHILKLKVIAEGVETEEQMKFLRSRNCDEAQGYLFSKPLPAEELAQLLVNKSKPY